MYTMSSVCPLTFPAGSVYGRQIGMVCGGLGGGLHVPRFGHELFYLRLHILNVLALHARDLEQLLSFFLTPYRVSGHRIFALKKKNIKERI